MGKNQLIDRLTAQVGGDLEHSRVEVYTTSGSTFTVGSRLVPEPIRGAGSQTHYVVTWDEASDLITLYINGTLMCQFTDHDAKQAASKGIIALQMHPGPPMNANIDAFEMAGAGGEHRE